MKVKTPFETAGIGKGHRYLGHFAKAKHINRGHNTDPYDTPVTPEKPLPGDKATLAQFDDNLARVKSDEYWDEYKRQYDETKAMNQEVEKFVAQQKKTRRLP